MEARNQNPKRWHSELAENWKPFLVVGLHPLVLTFLVISIVLIIYASSQTDSKMATILSILLSLTTGLLGGIASKKWDDLTQEKVILTRGKSANRNLQLLLERSISLEKRVTVYLHRYSDETYRTNITPEVLITYLEEIIQECISIENFIVNAIQDWTDILPEADIKSIISYIQELRNKAEEIQYKHDLVTNELKQLKEETTEEKKALIKEKRALEDELRRVRSEAYHSVLRSGVPNISESLISGGSITAKSLIGSSISDIDSSLSLGKSRFFNAREESGLIKFDLGSADGLIRDQSSPTEPPKTKPEETKAEVTKP